MEITRRDFAKSGLMLLVGIVGCNSLKPYDISSLIPEQKEAYEYYLSIDPKNLTAGQEQSLKEFYSFENQSSMKKEVSEMTKEELVDYKNVLRDYPWIKQDLFEYRKNPAEIVGKLNRLKKRDLLFLINSFNVDAVLLVN